MCNLSYGIAEEAAKEAAIKATEETTIKVKLETKLEDIRNMMQNLHLDFDTIANAMNIPLSERPEYRKLIESDT